jgi:MmyB-like transcription regulator ligand binding domain
VNLAEWRGHLLSRLQRQVAATGDAQLAGLLTELRHYPGAEHPGGEDGSPAPADVVVPLRYRYGDRELSLFSMTAVVGTPMDVTIEELAIESFYPADQATTEALWARREGLAEQRRPAAGELSG